MGNQWVLRASVVIWVGACGGGDSGAGAQTALPVTGVAGQQAPALMPAPAPTGEPLAASAPTPTPAPAATPEPAPASEPAPLPAGQSEPLPPPPAAPPAEEPSAGDMLGGEWTATCIGPQEGLTAACAACMCNVCPAETMACDAPCWDAIACAQPCLSLGAGEIGCILEMCPEFGAAFLAPPIFPLDACMVANASGGGLRACEAECT